MSMPAFTTGWNSSGLNRVDPGSAKKIEGWDVDEEPSSSTFNWILWVIESWLVWLSGLFGYANNWTGAQTFQLTAGFNGGANFFALSEFFAPLSANESVGFSNIGTIGTGTTQLPNTAGPIVLGPATGTPVLKLPVSPSVVGQIHVFNCNTATSLQILPPTGGTLNGNNDVTGITITTYQTLRVFWNGTGGNWFTF